MLYEVLVAALLIYSSRAEEDAAFVCRCQREIVDCTESQLTEYPKLNDLANTTKKVIFDQNAILAVRTMEPSSTITDLSFKHNLINKIEDRAFIGLENLVNLDLSHNQLISEELRPIIFKGQDKPDSVGILHLKKLDLSSNSLHTLHQDLFEFLIDLEELNLASNPFRILDHGTLVALSSIHKIKVIDLSSTQLSNIPSHWLNAAKNLETLNISLNHLTTVPAALEEARGLRNLVLNGNPITVLSQLPKLPTLRRLEMNWMAELTAVEEHSLVNLSNLSELIIANCHSLTSISEEALIEPGFYDKDRKDAEGAVYPPITTLDLSNNKLEYLEQNLFERWDKIKELKLDSNPWICDCKNQWMVSTLIPLMGDTKNGAPNTLICGAPIEMKGKSMFELSMRNYEMRCLDMYGNEPDRDAKVLIIVLSVVLIAIPLALLVLHLIKKPRHSIGYPTAFYRRAHAFESIN